MEGLAPPLKCLIEIQSALRNGETARAGLSRFAQSHVDEFAENIRSFLFDWDQGRDWRLRVSELKSPYRRALIELAAHAMTGHSIQARLDELKVEIEKACDAEIKAHVEMLPLRMLFPMLLFLFPSYLMLLFGPLLNSFLKEMSR